MPLHNTRFTGAFIYWERVFGRSTTTYLYL